MILARIVGTVVATRKDARLVSNKLLVARPMDPRGKAEGTWVLYNLSSFWLASSGSNRLRSAYKLGKVTLREPTELRYTMPPTEKGPRSSGR